MKIQITIGDQSFEATLTDSAAARDLVAQLPVTVDMVDHGGVEKTGPLPSPLSLEGQPEGADPDVGDVGYYAPGNDLVLYYGDQSYFPGIVVLGRLDGDAAERIAGMRRPGHGDRRGTVTARRYARGASGPTQHVVTGHPGVKEFDGETDDPDRRRRLHGLRGDHPRPADALRRRSTASYGRRPGPRPSRS